MVEEGRTERASGLHTKGKDHGDTETLLEENVKSLSSLDMLGCHRLSIWRCPADKKRPDCRKGDIRVRSRSHPHTGAGKTK